jgi:transcriptional regulator with XRE-family HTH domain
MSNLKIFEQNSLNSYVDNNREKIDAALVSLRIIKQIDNFLDYNELNQKDLANKLEVSEAFVSQLMSGSKKINVQILNKFEKKFNVEFEFKLRSKSSMYSVIEVVNNSIELKSFRPEFSSVKTFCFSNNSNSVYNLDTDYNPIVITK